MNAYKNLILILFLSIVIPTHAIGDNQYSWLWEMYSSELKEIEIELKVNNYDESNKVSAILDFANNDNPKAQYLLAFMYLSGVNIAKNYEKAIHYFGLSGILGYSNGYLQLARIYYSGNIVSRNYKVAEQYYIDASIQGNAEAMSELAPIYYNAYGGYREGVRKVIPEDKEKALVLYKSASILGNTYAMRMLAHIYYVGDIVSKDYNKAFTLFSSSLRQKCDSNENIYYRLGLMYFYGLGTTVDYTKALIHFYAFNNYYKTGFSNDISSIEIAYMYYMGLGVEKNVDKAINLVNKIKSSSLASIGLSYCTGGWYLVEDFDKATIIFNILRQRKDADAYYFLGEMYYQGYIIEKDYINSVFYFKKATNHGHPQSEQKLIDYELWSYQ